MKTPSDKEALRRSLQRLRTTMGNIFEAEAGFAYRGAADFVLRNGRFYEPRSFPEGIYPRMMPRMCYGNALLIAARWGLRYVEGFASPHGGRDIPIMHAWNLDHDDTVIDTTWVNLGCAYMGVIFAPERADDATWEGDASILDDFKRGWPIFREPWAGEHEWPPSDRVETLRSGSDEEIAAFFEIAGARSKGWEAATEESIKNRALA